MEKKVRCNLQLQKWRYIFNMQKATVFNIQKAGFAHRIFVLLMCLPKKFNLKIYVYFLICSNLAKTVTFKKIVEVIHAKIRPRQKEKEL